jgi:hypothetical protein
VMHQGARLLTARASVVLIALAAIGVVPPSAAHNEDPSYQAGYAAASNPNFVRTALTDGRMSSSSFCDELLKRRIFAVQSGIRHSDFHRGCEHAIHDVME